MELSIPSTCGLLVYQVGHKRTSWPSETKSIVADLVSTKLILFFSGRRGVVVSPNPIWCLSLVGQKVEETGRVESRTRHVRRISFGSTRQIVFANDLFDFFPPSFQLSDLLPSYRKAGQKNRQLSFSYKKRVSINHRVRWIIDQRLKKAISTKGEDDTFIDFYLIFSKYGVW